MDARRFDDRPPRRESDMRNLAIVMGGLLILLVGAVFFLIFAFNSRPSPIGVVDPTSSPRVPASPSSAATVPLASVAPPTATATPTPTASPTPLVTLPPPPPTAATPTPTLTPRAPLAGDEPTDALAIASIPFSQSLDPKRATEGASDKGCDDVRSSSKTVWFKYTATSDDALGAYTAGSEYGTVLVVNRLNADGSLEMVDCNVWSPQDGSAVRIAAKSGVTYLFMVGSIGRRSGEVHFALEAAPKRASVNAALELGGTFDDFGHVNLWLTTHCSGDIQYFSVEIELRQVVNREVHTIYGYWDLSNCRHEQTWNLEMSSDEFVFGSEPATAFMSISYSDRFESHWLRSSSEVELAHELGPFPSPSPGPA